MIQAPLMQSVIGPARAFSRLDAPLSQYQTSCACMASGFNVQAIHSVTCFNMGSIIVIIIAALLSELYGGIWSTCDPS